MSDLIVVSFDKLDDARSAMKGMRELEHQDAVRFEDTAIVERAADGKVHVKNELSGTTEKAAVVGAFVGLFLTVFFPVVGIAIGAAAGGAKAWPFHSRRLTGALTFFRRCSTIERTRSSTNAVAIVGLPAPRAGHGVLRNLGALAYSTGQRRVVERSRTPHPSLPRT